MGLNGTDENFPCKHFIWLWPGEIEGVKQPENQTRRSNGSRVVQAARESRKKELGGGSMRWVRLVCDGGRGLVEWTLELDILSVIG